MLTSYTFHRNQFDMSKSPDSLSLCNVRSWIPVYSYNLSSSLCMANETNSLLHRRRGEDTDGEDADREYKGGFVLRDGVGEILRGCKGAPLHQ